MADMITRCPKCGTAFRISDALLKSAKGVVRCGSCLSVFNAKEHMEVKPAPRPQPSTYTPTPTSTAPAHPPKAPLQVPAPTRVPVSPTPPAFEPSMAEDDQEEDDQDLRSDWRITPAADRGGLFERSTDNREDDTDLDDEDDEAWALELLKDDSDLNVRFKKVTEVPTKPTPPAVANAAGLSKPFATSLAEATPVTPDTEVFPPKNGASSKNPASSRTTMVSGFDSENVDAETEVEEITAAPPPASPGAGRTGLNAAGNTATGTNNFATGEAASGKNQSSKTAVSTTKADARRKPIRPKLEAKSVPLEDVIAAIEPEPLEVAWQQPGAWKKRLLWPALALLALLCLLIQVAWLEFHRLNRVEPYRSVYAVACGLIGCELPEMADRTQIQTSNLLVRSHPELAEILLVDVILQNNAPFEQPFPALQLTFTNLQNEPVASRTLTPEEYLGGELAGQDKMPVRQPIHIGLEIADPGSTAVSYHITIVD